MSLSTRPSLDISRSGALTASLAPADLSAASFCFPGFDMSFTAVARPLSAPGDPGDGDEGPWTTESSNSMEDGDSGDDGYGGTYSWSEIFTWHTVSTSDAAGNSSYTEHDTHTYVFHRSGTTSDGVSYVVDFTATDTYDLGRQGYPNGTSHSLSNQVSDASYQSHADDGAGSTYDDGGTYHATSDGYNHSSPIGIYWGSTDDSHGEDHFTRHGEAGASTLDESGSDFATHHIQSDSFWLNVFAPVRNVTDDTYDSGGQQQGTSHILSAAGDVEDKSYSDEDATHKQSRTTSDRDIDLYTYAASNTYNANGWEKSDTVAANGDASGYNWPYQEQNRSDTDPDAGSISEWSRDAGGSDYGSYAIAAPDGYSEGGTFSDSYANHDEWYVDADGNYTSSWTSSGSGEDTYYLNFAAGANYMNVTGRDADSYSAYGGTSADGTRYYSSIGEVHGDDDFTLHVEDDLGNALDESGTDYYQAQAQAVDDDMPAITGACGGTAHYTLTHPDGSTESGDDSYSYPYGSW